MNINQNNIKLTSYISINGWMISNLPKVGISTMNEVMIFAIIYSYSKEPNTMFTGALPYLIKQSLTSRTTCIKILTKLTELQLIFKKVDGQRNYYYVNQSRLHELQNEMPEVETSPNIHQSKIKLVQNPTQTGTESDTNQSNFRTRLVQNPTQTGTESAPYNIYNRKYNKEDNIFIDRDHVFFSGLDDKTIDALIQWINYQQKYGKTPQQIMNPVFRKMLDTQVEAGNDIAFSINYTMSIDAKNLIYKPDPVAEAKNKNLSPEERKKQKEVQLKKEDRHNILSNYCKGVTYEVAYMKFVELNRRKDAIQHRVLTPQEVITKSECDKYMIKYPTRGDWEMLNTEREGFLLTSGNFLDGDCK